MKNINHKPSLSLLASQRSVKVIVASLGLSLASPTMAASYGLHDIYQMAMSYDAKLAQAKAQVNADKETINSVKGVLLPQVNAEASYFITDSDNRFSDNESANLSLNLNQSLYDHANWARYEQAKYINEAADATLKKAQQDVILRVAESYFDVLLAEKSLQLSKTKEEADFTQLETAQASAELGLSSMVDVLEAKSNYDLSKSETINAENQLDIALENLANISGKSVANIKSNGLKQLLSDVELPQLNLKISELEAKAKLQNLDVINAQTQLGQATEEISVKKSGHLPSVSFQAQYQNTDYSKVNSGAAFNDNESTRYGVVMSIPIFSGGSTRSEVTAAKQQTIAAQEALRDTRQTAALNVRTQVKNLKQGEKLVKALREAVKSNDAFLDSAEEGYRVGLRSLLEVLTARTNQTNAQRNLIEAVHNQVLNKMRLEASIGDLTVDDILEYEPLLQAQTS